MSIYKQFEEILEKVERFCKEDQKDTQELMYEISTIYQTLGEGMKNLSPEEREELMKKLPEMQARLGAISESLNKRFGVDYNTMMKMRTPMENVAMKNLEQKERFR